MILERFFFFKIDLSSGMAVPRVICFESFLVLFFRFVFYYIFFGGSFFNSEATIVDKNDFVRKTVPLAWRCCEFFLQYYRVFIFRHVFLFYIFLVAFLYSATIFDMKAPAPTTTDHYSTTT